MPRSVDKFKHNGLRCYNSQESQNSVLRQGGVDLLFGTSTTAGRIMHANEEGTDTTNDAYFPNTRHWIQIRAVDADIRLQAETLIGDDLSLDGVYRTTGTPANNAYDIVLTQGEILNGTFKKIRMRTGARLEAVKG
tara:strand:- start:245 stop:652 length:408 start_codon:yes stop_codon:yes gene_type:complete